MAVRPDRLLLGAVDAHDLEGADGAFTARVALLEEVEREVDRLSEVGGLEAQAEVKGGRPLEHLVNLVPMSGRMAWCLGHAATPFRFER